MRLKFIFGALSKYFSHFRSDQLNQKMNWRFVQTVDSHLSQQILISKLLNLIWSSWVLATVEINIYANQAMVDPEYQTVVLGFNPDALFPW